MASHWATDSVFRTPAGDGPPKFPFQGIGNRRLALARSGARMSSIPLSIHLVRPRDLAALQGVSSVLPLNQPEASLAPFRPFSAALTSILPRRNRGRMIVAHGDNRVLAFAHFVPELPDSRWQLVALGSSTGVYDVTPLWEQVLERSITLAGLRGVKRLYARPPAGSPAEMALFGVGFQPYATETIYAARSPSFGNSALKLREQTQSDTWAIHQLYNAITPRQVQYAEAYTSHRWDVDAVRAAPSGAATNGWVLEEAFQIVAYARTISFGSNHVLELLVHPEWSGETGDLIDAALHRLVANRRIDRVSCALRGYQQELGGAFMERGFRPTAELTLSVKYTAARATAPVLEPVVQTEAVLERLPKPKRAPSYLFWQKEE